MARAYGKRRQNITNVLLRIACYHRAEGYMSLDGAIDFRHQRENLWRCFLKEQLNRQLGNEIAFTFRKG